VGDDARNPTARANLNPFDLGTERRGIAASERSKGVGVFLVARARGLCAMYISDGV